jgi:SAM-dependent methyltransferase
MKFTKRPDARGKITMRVNNELLSFFWDSLDYPIRFLYCRSKIFNNMMFWSLYSSDFESLDKSFDDIFLILSKNKVPIKNAKILELGPGNSFIMAYNFLMRNAKKIILVDKFPRVIKTKKQNEYFHKELEFIKKKYGRSPFFLSDGTIDTKYLEYFQKDLKEIQIEDVDFIYSNSVMEHIKNVHESVATMARILKPGGYMYHNIDMRDHYNFNSPFLFYKYDDSTWNRFLTKEGISYTNRMRCDDFMEVFDKNGFEIVELRTEREKLNQKKMSSKFAHKSKEALEISKLGVLARKK